MWRRSIKRTGKRIRNFEIIGEATKKVPKSIKKKYPDVEWNKAAGFENILKNEGVVITDKPSKKP